MPSRRDLLAGAGSTLLPLVAGCQTEGDLPPAAGSTSTTTVETATPAASGTVELERESYWLDGRKLPSSVVGYPEDEITPLSDLDSPTSGAVKTAITDGRYATDDPSDALLDGIDSVSLVRYEGTVYDVSHTFPTYTLSLDTDVQPASAPEDRTVKLRSEAVRSNETLEDVVYTVTPHGTEHDGSQYTTTRLPDAVREFLGRYDYVQSGHGVGELVLSHTERTPPHTITATEASEERLYGRDVLELDSFLSTGRRLVTRTLEDDRRTPLGHDDRSHSIFPDDIPDPMDRRLDEESSFVRVDGTIYGFSARHLHWDDHPFDVSARLVEGGDESETAVRVELAAKNTASRTAELVMPGVAPFGVLWAYGPGGERVLWRQEYRQRDEIVVEDGRVVPEYHDERSVAPGDRVGATYRLGRDRESVESGEYVVPGFVWPKWPTEDGLEKFDWRSEIYPYTLTISVR